MTIEKIFEFAFKQRPKLKDSVGYRQSADLSGIPSQLHCIYQLAIGTNRNVKDQTVLDLIPGYRLIHISELADEKKICGEMVQSDDFFPFFADYSCRYIALNTPKGSVYRVSSDGGSELLSFSVATYLNTIEAFYSGGAYFLDSDGFLDYDFDKEGEIGAKLNPFIAYWS